MGNTKTILHYYRFALDKADEREQYFALCKILEDDLHLKKFDSISPEHSKWYRESIVPLNGETIELETKFLFDNQWNTAPTKTSDNGLRVFDWAEAIYPNRDIREGQWLEQTDEMIGLRNDNLKCHWCGNVSPKAVIVDDTCPFCDAVGFRLLTTGGGRDVFTVPKKEQRDGVSHSEIIKRNQKIRQVDNEDNE